MTTELQTLILVLAIAGFFVANFVRAATATSSS